MGIPVTPLNTFGYQFGDSNDFLVVDRSRERLTRNITTPLGYLPVIGNIIGIGRMILVWYTVNSLDITDDDHAEIEYYRAEFCRGAVEGLTFGASYFIPDVLVTRADGKRPIETLGFIQTRHGEFMHNTSIVLGWIPAVGTIVGLARLIFAVIKLNQRIEALDQQEEESIREYYKDQCIRAGVEILSLGFTLIMPDITMTRLRNRNFEVL